MSDGGYTASFMVQSFERRSWQWGDRQREGLGLS
jgi:hypothetical protein